MGGKSSSSQKSSSSSTTTTSTVQNVTNDTRNAESSGVVGRNLIQGENLTYVEEFGDDVAGAFGQLVDLANRTIEGAGQVAASSLIAVSKRADAIDNPDIATTRAFQPLVLAGIGTVAVLGLLYIWKVK